ncbi:MAG: SDR family oxidoreductase [Acidimicrobiia bacterium]
MGQLDGKVAIVTGATSGSGRAIARRFVKEGATVGLVARTKSALDETCADIGEGAVALQCDIGDPDQVRAAFKIIEDRCGKLDVLVNNTGVGRPSPVEELTDDDIMFHVRGNYLGPVYTARSAIPLMLKAGGGDIVNTSSESTLYPMPYLSLYTSTKAAVEKFSQVMGIELRHKNIRVTEFVQGVTAESSFGNTWDPKFAAKAYEEWMSGGYMAACNGAAGPQDPNNVADVTLFVVTRPRTQMLDRIHVRAL